MSGESVPTPTVAQPKHLVGPVEPEIVGPFSSSLTEDHPASNTSNNRILKFDDDKIQIHEYIGDYRIEKLLGSGGMGNVFRVQNQFFGRVEALKMLHDQLETRDARDAFIAEMQTQSRLNHTNIVKVHYAGVCRQSGACRNRLYLVMSLEPGDLAEQLRERGAFRPVEAAEIVRRLAKALIHAHSHGVIHCDLKPKNILVGDDGTPKVTDFGLVKILHSSGGDGGLRDGFPFGTLGYMPPEQARGERSRVKPTNDIYGLGAVLYELLTGQPPYTGTRDEILRRVKDLNDAPPSPRSLNPRVPARLSAICMKCLEKRPLRRYQTAEELECALDAFVRKPLVQRRWRELTIAGLVIVLAAIGWTRLPSPRAEAQSKLNVADSQRRQKSFDDAIKSYGDAKNALEEARSSLAVLDHSELTDRINEVDSQLASARRDHVREISRKADSARDRGDTPAEIQALTEADLACERHNSKTDPPLAEDHIRILARLAELHEKERRNNEYNRVIQRAELLISQTAKNDQCDLAAAEIDHIKGNHAATEHDYRKAREVYQQGLNRRRNHEESHKTDQDFCRDLARSHGYIADILLVTGEPSALVRDHYREARRLREELARQNPRNAESHCLHARDFENDARLACWDDKLPVALSHRRQHLKYYEDHLPQHDHPRLPSRFLTERAAARITLCEYSCLTGTAGDAEVQMLEPAERELEQLAQPREEDTLVRVRMVLARLHLARARLSYLKSDYAAMAQHLNEARRRYQSLDDRELLEADEYFQMAVVCSLSSAVPEQPEFDRLKYQILALDHLRKAIRKNFVEIWWLNYDPGLKPIRIAHADRFAEIKVEMARSLEDIRKQH
jgi:serine/threonine protein kinase